MMLRNILTPMNHREIDFYAKELPDSAIPSVFSCIELLEWLDKTSELLFDEDLVMDYGTDCLRLYLLFEKTPKENDAPYYDSWNEGALEGIYKFLGRYHRLVPAAAEWNRRGKYEGVMNDKDYFRIQAVIENAKQKISDCIMHENTTANRHKIVSVLMELQKVLQREMKINEIIAELQAHAIETAVPRGWCEDNGSQAVQLEEYDLNRQLDSRPKEYITQICQSYIAIMAPFCPNISKILWKNLL